MSDSVLWSVPAMQAGHDEIDSVQRQLDATFQQLTADLAPMREFWAGQGSESYDAVQARWNQAMQDMVDLLASINRSLEEAIGIHEQTEQSIIGAWES